MTSADRHNPSNQSRWTACTGMSSP